MFGENQNMDLAVRREEPWYMARENAKDHSQLRTPQSGWEEFWWP